MSGLWLFCRAGFESDCAAEIQDKASQLGVYGYCQAKAGEAFVVFRCQAEEAEHLASKLPLKELIFTRQWLVILAEMDLPAEGDRVSPILTCVAENQQRLGLLGELTVTTPDTNEAKSVAGFTKKFTVPLRQALRGASLLSQKPLAKRPSLQVVFINKVRVVVGFSFSFNQAPWAGGIPRLRMPGDAPSRSTLKLDEAFSVFVAKEEHEQRLQSGLRAVDLGAAPGGWTYQLVRRGMMVTAVDNGPMAESLMDTGQVSHVREDGFRYLPKKRNVHWLVCDMVEKPARVGELMTEWLLQDYCKEAIFNLKLPMKQRYLAVNEYLQHIKEQLQNEGHGRFELQAKQLYHDREEVTVHARWL
ncbi:23S rRNA (cytidine(2498)-2'-O)-methyltransferase RlmM [Idiomarina tyrosinivorans]|uniref:Ribosomal RNA large subunit methyltransferase M n=2 Tax=Idiomarina tyrosinivorans TaxID=1445662 RepID=A0A432ZRP1_9GAMM|nr:23S rRNA (cytidine(2498)-2'-O)-methyltransferase RlmM [Idiomarina tyrosinivorans]RUO80543.1 23S rRNA (cytidine(2498)-2'-O)-methyltransferase RlmM [Idiomarina tyrosinivorans]